MLVWRPAVAKSAVTVLSVAVRMKYFKLHMMGFTQLYQLWRPWPIFRITSEVVVFFSVTFDLVQFKIWMTGQDQMHDFIDCGLPTDNFWGISLGLHAHTGLPGIGEGWRQMHNFDLGSQMTYIECQTFRCYVIGWIFKKNSDVFSAPFIEAMQWAYVMITDSSQCFIFF